MQKYQLKITHIQDMGYDTKTYYFEKPDNLTWQAGSHIHMAHLDYTPETDPDKTLVRHMSITTTPEEGFLGVTTRVPGSHSLFKTRLGALSVGDAMQFFKLGSRLTLKEDGKPVIFLAMGVGIATFRSMWIQYTNQPTTIPYIRMIHIDSKASVWHDWYPKLPYSPNIYTHLLENRDDFYQTIEDYTYQSANYYIVGSGPFIRTLIPRLIKKGVSADAIHIDKKPEARPLFFGLDLIRES